MSTTAATIKSGIDSPLFRSIGAGEALAIFGSLGIGPAPGAGAAGVGSGAGAAGGTAGSVGAGAGFGLAGIGLFCGSIIILLNAYPLRSVYAALAVESIFLPEWTKMRT